MKNFKLSIIDYKQIAMMSYNDIKGDTGQNWDNPKIDELLKDEFNYGTLPHNFDLTDNIMSCFYDIEQEDEEN